MPEKLIIFDTTLRDGEQTPGASLNIREKVEIAKQLERLGVDVIEGGFPFASPGDFLAVTAISKEIKGATIVAGLARALKKDIDRAYEALRHAKRPRIHVFLATSPIHRQFKLKKAQEEIIKQASEAVAYARTLVKDVEFSPEDASRTEPDFLSKVVEAVIKAGARTVNIPDTVGYTAPSEFRKLIRYLKDTTPNIDKAVISVHCHNDLGLAVANSIAAVESGARQVECTINGLGERAGNASLEEIVMIINTRRDIYKDVYTDINAKQITKTSRLVSHLTGIVVQPNKAIVGENAFAHESGIHQDGVLKERSTYEIMDPASVGLTTNRLVLGKLSGRHAFKSRLEQMGFKLKDAEVDKAFARFKDLADKKKVIYDEDLAAIVEDEFSDIPPTYLLDYIAVTSGNRTLATATVVLKKGEEVFQDASTGDGPVDAVYKTVDRITGVKGKLADYALRALTGGKDAMGEVSVRVEAEGGIYHGKGASTDVIEASAKAYLNAINRALFRKKNTKVSS